MRGCAQLNYALIGCGRISLNHIAAALRCGFNIIALCDVNIKAAQKLKEQFDLKMAKIYDDYCHMIAVESIDVVSIATHSGCHAEIAVKCCEAKINVIIEKPIALSLYDAMEVNRAATKSGVLATVCHQNRYNKAVTKAKELVDSGALGALYCVSANVLWNRGETYYSQSEWRGTWAQDGGVLMNQGIHNIDLLRWFVGEKIDYISSMISNAQHPYIEVEDIGVAILRFSNGCLGTINCTSNVFPTNLEETIYILGSKGTIKLGGKSVNKIEELRVDGLQNAEAVIEEFSNIPPNVYGYGHFPLFENFRNAILGKEKLYIQLYDAIESLELVLGIYKSAQEKNDVNFPIGEFSTLDMKGWNNGVQGN